MYSRNLSAQAALTGTTPFAWEGSVTLLEVTPVRRGRAGDYPDQPPVHQVRTPLTTVATPPASASVSTARRAPATLIRRASN